MKKNPIPKVLAPKHNQSDLNIVQNTFAIQMNHMYTQCELLNFCH